MIAAMSTRRKQNRRPTGDRSRRVNGKRPARSSERLLPGSGSVMSEGSRGLVRKSHHGVGRVRVLSVDTVVRSDQHIHNTNEIRLQGAGGTNMTAGIGAAAETNPDAIVVITDGWTPWPPTRPPGARNVIVALTDNRSIDRVPDWIQTININEHPGR